MSAEWLASSDEESWDGYVSWATREEAVAGGPDELCLEGGEPYFVGRKVPQRTDGLVAPWMASLLGERVQERELEDLSSSLEFGEDWLQLTNDEADDLAARLSRALEEFIRANPKHQPTWFTVRDVTEHVAPDVAAEVSESVEGRA